MFWGQKKPGIVCFTMPGFFFFKLPKKKKAKEKQNRKFWFSKKCCHLNLDFEFNLFVFFPNDIYFGLYQGHDFKHSKKQITEDYLLSQKSYSMI